MRTFSNMQLNYLESVCNAPYSGSSGPSGLVGFSGLAIGKYWNDSNSDQPLSCAVFIDELRIWKAERLQDDILSCIMTPCADFQHNNQGLILCYEFVANSSIVVDRGQGESSNGFALERATGQCSLLDYNAGSLGWCIGGKPLLPGAGLMYEASDFSRLVQSFGDTNLTNIHMFFSSFQADGEEIPPFLGCATAPVRFKNNSALSGYGGAVYQSGCNNGLNARGYCFFTGLSESTGSALIVFENNFASSGGGAVYTDCDILVTTCTKSLGSVLGVPGFQKTQYSQVYFLQNSVGGYGPNVATAPSQLLLPSPNGFLGLGKIRVTVPLAKNLYAALKFSGNTNVLLSYIPGQDKLDIAFVLLDGIGTVVVGSATNHLPFVLIMLFCDPAVGTDCNFENALSGPSFHTFDSITGIGHTLSQSPAIVCPSGPHGDLAAVNVFLFVSGTNTPFLSCTIQLSCRECQEGQSRTRSVAPGSRHLSWTCPSCLPTQYVIDPNKFLCRNCPGQVARSHVNSHDRIFLTDFQPLYNPPH